MSTLAPPRLEPPAPAAGIWGAATRRLTAGLVLVVVAAAFEALAVATTLPAAARNLGGLMFYGWAFSAFLLTNLIGLTVAGDEADRHGPARPFAFGVVLFTIGLLIAGTAPAMLVLVAGRAVQGVGAGIISSVAYVAVGRGYPEAARARMLAVLSTAWVVPGLVGPAAAGLVTAQFGWRWVFLGLAPLPVIAAALALPVLRQLRQDASARPTWSRAVAATALAAGTAVLLAGLGARSLLLAAPLVVGGAALAIGALRRLLPAGVLRAEHGLPAVIAASGLLNFGLFGVDAFVPLSLTAFRDQSIALAGIPLTTASVGWAAGSWLQARYANRRDRGRLVQLGMATVILGVVGVAAALLPSTPVPAAWLAWGVAGLGMGLAFSTLSLLMLDTATPGQEGLASSSLQVANGLGSALSAGIGGALIAATSVAGQPRPAGLVTQDALMLAGLALGLVVAGRLVKARAQTAPG